MKLIRIAAFLGLLLAITSCKTYNSFYHNPAYDGCNISAKYLDQDKLELSSFLKRVKQEVESKIDLPNGNLKEILMWETITGGDGNGEVLIIYFNTEKIVPLVINYGYLKSIRQIDEIELKNLSSNKHNKLLKLLESMSGYSELNLCVECFSGTAEQELTFYIKDNDQYIFQANFENFYFEEYPGLGIGENLMSIVKILESIK